MLPGTLLRLIPESELPVCVPHSTDLLGRALVIKDMQLLRPTKIAGGTVRAVQPNTKHVSPPPAALPFITLHGLAALLAMPAVPSPR